MVSYFRPANNRLLTIDLSPGKQLSAFILKTVVAYLLSNFDFRLAYPDAPRVWQWEAFNMPYQSARILFRKRSEIKDGR